MNIKELNTELKKLAKTYRMFAEAEELVDGLAGVDQNKKELEAAVATLKKEMLALKTAKVDAENELIRMDEARKGIIDDAGKASAKIKADTIALLEAEKAKAKDELALIRGELATANERKDAALAELKEAQAKKAEIDALIAKAKAALGA